MIRDQQAHGTPGLFEVRRSQVIQGSERMFVLSVCLTNI